ncbi:MAG: DUF5690 family protein [Bacteroidota bacterium]
MGKPKSHQLRTTLLCASGAFITYCSMYAFRKPFTAATYEGLSLWGVDYKIVLITTQVIGYMLSKFIGIKVVSEMGRDKRISYLLGLIGLAWASLLLFAWVPYPYNFALLFFNGLPLGMIWGIVFAFLEGRRNTELLGAAMSSSFVLASGTVKGVGRFLIDSVGIPEFWMPFVTGLLFVPSLLFGIYLLTKIQPPSLADIAQRTERIPMDAHQRKAFFRKFGLGIVLTVIIYMALTIFRDVRDNFAVELWILLGYADVPQILALAEIPIAIGVFTLTAAMIFIKDNKKAFYVNLGIIALGGFFLMLTTYLFQNHGLSPILWMILVGFAMYLSYISYHTMLFERWIALYKYRSNIGFLMYLADAFGYLGSVGILFYKNFGQQEVDWLSFTQSISYIFGMAIVILSILAIFYFLRLEKRLF